MAEINHCGQCQRFKAFRCAVTGHAIQNGYAMAHHAKHCAHKTKTDAEIVPDAPGRNRDSMIARHAILAVLLFCGGCVTAPNSNLAITIDLFSSHSRYGQALGGTNTTIKGHSDGGGALTATVPMSP